MPLTGEPFNATADWYDTGLAGTLLVGIFSGATAVVPMTTAGVQEVGSTGVYVAALVAPAVPGDYLIVWDDGSGQTASEPLVVGLGTGGFPLPTIDDVAALLRARTQTPAGGQVGTFDATTRPTGDEVTLLILQSSAYVAGVLGGSVPERLYAWVRHLTALYTAVQIEEGYFPEQVATGRSPRAQLWERFMTELPSLLSAVEAFGGGGIGGTSDRVGRSVFTPPAPGVWDVPYAAPGSLEYALETEALGTQPTWPPRLTPDGPALPRV